MTSTQKPNATIRYDTVEVENWLRAMFTLYQIAFCNDVKKHISALLIKHKTIDTPKIVNIFILYVSTINLSHLQKNVTPLKLIFR